MVRFFWPTLCNVVITVLLTVWVIGAFAIEANFTVC